MWTTLPATARHGPPPAAALLPHREARETTPGPPGAGTGYLWWGPQKHAGVRVSEQDILKIGACWACIRYVAESLALLDWNVYRALEPRGQEYQPANDVDWLIDRQCNPEWTSAFTFREVMLAWAMTWGSAYAEIAREPYRNRPVALWPITPNRVRPERTRAGRLVYDVQNPGGPNKVLDAEDVFHLRGLSWDGLLGYRAAAVAGEMFGLALAAQEFAGAFFANDATPGGVLATEQTLGKPAAERVSASWKAAHAGPAKAYVVAVLEQGLKWIPTGTDPQKSQMQETRRQTAYEVAGFFRVPPHKIGLLENAAKANMEQQGREAVQDCLMPWGKRLEAEADMKLLGPRQGARLFTRIDYSVVHRADTQTLTDHIMKLMDRGVYDVDEARSLLDLNPIGKAAGGEKRFFPLNFTTLDKAGESPPPAAKPGGASSGDAPGAGGDNRPTPGRPAALLAAARGVLADAVRSLAKKEANHARRVVKARGDFDAWCADFWPKQRLLLAGALGPITQVFSAAGRDVGALRLAELLAADAEAALKSAYDTKTPEQFAALLADWPADRAAAADKLLEGL